MNIAFRCDASLDIGAGHVMRCLTLANELRAYGAQCRFICREHPGNLIGLIRDQGFDCTVLPPETAPVPQPDRARALYTAWLGAGIDQDAAQTIASLEGGYHDWLVVDHYALDRQWERQVRAGCKRLMVIDDLADRPHECDLLLDQTLGRRVEDYAALTASGTQLLCGTDYALLRPEFAQWRDISLGRRSRSALHNILITMGGVDRDNATTGVLEALEGSSLASGIMVTVVMGKTAPWLLQVKQQADKSRFSCRVLSNVDNMARLMSEADLAIGAVGATSWERCVLGLPAIVAVLAENQIYAAAKLEQAGAVLLFSSGDTGENSLGTMVEKLAIDLPSLAEMSLRAAAMVDGSGCIRVVEQLLVMGNGH